MGNELNDARMLAGNRDSVGRRLRPDVEDAIRAFARVRSGRLAGRHGLAAPLCCTSHGIPLAVVRSDRPGRPGGAPSCHGSGTNAHIERRPSGENTRTGIAAARARGRTPGRQPVARAEVAVTPALVAADLSLTNGARPRGGSSVCRGMVLAGRRESP
jgi:hypothetical protein